MLYGPKDVLTPPPVCECRVYVAVYRIRKLVAEEPSVICTALSYAPSTRKSNLLQPNGLINYTTVPLLR